MSTKTSWGCKKNCFTSNKRKLNELRKNYPVLKKLLLFRHILEIFDFFVNKESINVNGAIKAISNLFIFFLRKSFTHTKSTKSRKSTTTQTSQKGTFFPLDVFMHIKMLPFLFLFACLHFVRNLFVKKIKKSKIALMASSTLLLIIVCF